MANEHRQHVQHIRSSQLISGTPKLPTAEQIGFGEIAINFATDHETLSIKNYSGDIVTFSADHIINSALTEFSGSVVESEEAIAAAFAQIADENDDILSALTELSASVIDNEEIIATALVQLDEDISAHTSNTEIHLSDSDRVKLDSIEEGAEANVQADWDVTNQTSPAYIRNKPNISSIDNSCINFYADGNGFGYYSPSDNEGIELRFSAGTGISFSGTSDNVLVINASEVELPGIATSAVSGFMSAEMAETVEKWEEKEKVIAQSIAVLGSRSDVVPMPSISAASQTSVTITVSGVQDTTHIITVPNNVEEFDLDVNNYGNLAIHKIIIDNTANEASDTTCQVNMGTYHFSGTNVVVGEEIYDTLEVSSDIVLVNSGESGNNVSVKPGKRMEIVLTPYMSGQTLETSFVVMASNGGNSGSGDGDGGSGTKIIMRNWSNE
jgi:hypothetical protein